MLQDQLALERQLRKRLCMSADFTKSKSVQCSYLVILKVNVERRHRQ